MKYKVGILLALLGIAVFGARGANNPHVTTLDLSIDGVDDGKEFLEPAPSTTPSGPGGFVCLGGWKKITLTAGGGNSPMKTRLNWNSGNIEVWTATTDGTKVSNPQPWDDAATMPTELRVKGVGVSATGPTKDSSGNWLSCGPEHLCLEAINNGSPYLCDRIAFTVIEVDLDGDIDMDGDIDDDDDPNENVADEPCLVVGVNNDTHTTASGDAEVDSADAVINGATDKSEDLKILKLSLAPLLTSGELVLRCTDNSCVRIFDASDAEVIGPSVGTEHTIQASSVPAAGLEYRIEAITGGEEVTCVLTYKPAAAEICPDAVKVSTVGMTALGAYCIASLHRSFAVNIVDGAGQPTDKYYVGVGSMSYPDHPAGVVVNLKNVVTPPVLEKLKDGTYKMFNATVFTVGCAVPLEDSIKSDPNFQGLLALYRLLYDPVMTEDGLYNWLVLQLGIPLADAQYYWMLPRIYTTGAQVFRIENYSAGGAKIKDITVTILSVELKEGTTVINEDDYVYITGTPQMPQLTASLKPTGLTGNAEWQLYIEYTRTDRGNRIGDKEYYPGPDASSWKTVSAGGTWDIASEFGTDFRGGKATLYCKYEGVECEQVFHIRGNNPTEAGAKAYLDANGPWYAYCIAKHESGSQTFGSPPTTRTYLQFNEVGTLGPNPGDYKHCPNRHADPGGTYGWGMMMLTRFEITQGGGWRSPGSGYPWAQELWSWKAQADTAITVLDNTCKDYVQNHLKNIAPDGAGGYIMPPDITVSGVSFAAGTAKTPDHLGIIKRYNGGYFWTAYDALNDVWTHVTLDAAEYTVKVLNEY